MVRCESVSVLPDGLSQSPSAVCPLADAPSTKPTDSFPPRLHDSISLLKEQAVNEGLAESKIDMIVNGRMNKYYEEVCLLDQFFIKENKVKVSAYLKNHGVEALEFIRYEVGEGMQKKEENFADEVMKQING